MNYVKPSKAQVFYTYGFWVLLGLLIAHFRGDIQRIKERDSLAFVLDGLRRCECCDK